MRDTAQNASKGIALMIAAMGAFAIADTLIKIASSALSPAHTTLLLISGSAVVFVTLALVQGQQLIDRAALSTVLLIRYTVEIIGTFSMVVALSQVPLSTVGAILQASPLVATVGAVWLLGEKVSWRRFSAIVLGFIGVLLIVQPGSEGFDSGVLWVILSMLSLSARDLTTRATPPAMATSSLSAYTMLAALPFALLWVLITQSSVLPHQADWWLVLSMVGFGTLGYLMITASIRVAPVSIVSPFRYTRLLFLLVLGVVIFNERPNALMLLGSVLVIGSGLYTMWRERQLTQISSKS